MVKNRFPKGVKVTDLTDDEVIEDIVVRLTEAIYHNDTRWIKEGLVEFAKEIISQAKHDLPKQEDAAGCFRT